MLLEQIKDTVLEVGNYYHKCIELIKPIWVFLYTGISYLLFPDESYIPPTIGLLIALFLDVITKYYSIAKQNGGLWNSIKTKKITSESLWRGSYKKIVSILIVMILCGLLMRFTAFLPAIATTVTTISYTFMFYREVQSILENMIDAGHDDLKWFLGVIKRKKNEVIEEHTDDIDSTQ